MSTKTISTKLLGFYNNLHNSWKSLGTLPILFILISSRDCNTDLSFKPNFPFGSWVSATFFMCDQMLQKIKYNSIEFPMFFYVGANKITQCGHDVWNWYHRHVPKILPNFWSNSIKVYIYVRNFAAILGLFSK